MPLPAKMAVAYIQQKMRACRQKVFNATTRNGVTLQIILILVFVLAFGVALANQF